MECEVYLLARPVTLKNLKGTMRAAIKKFELPLLQNIWHKVKCRLDVCRAATGAHIGLYRVRIALNEDLPSIFFTPITIVSIIHVITLY
jgi:hypothetical protein